MTLLYPYILIIWIHGYRDAALDHVKFYGYDACYSAGERLHKLDPAIGFICVKEMKGKQDENSR